MTKKKPVVTSKNTKPKKKQPITVKTNLRQRHEELELINKKLAQSQVALEAALLQFSDLYDFAPVGYFTFNPEGVIIQSNLAGARLLGIEHGHLIKQEIGAFVSARSRPAFNTLFEKLLTGQGKEICELELLKGGNSSFWVSVDASCFEGGLSSRVVMVDITERKQAEVTLRETQELFTQFMRHSPIYTFIKEVTPTESRVLQASENYLQMIGISGQDMKGKNMEELFPPESAAKFSVDDWSVITSGQVLKLDEGLNNRHYTSIKFPIVQGEKTLLAGYTIDITERVQAQEALKQSEEKYRTVANFTYDWEAWRGPDGTYRYVSPSCERVTGHTAAEFLADSNLAVRITHPDDQSMVSEHFDTTANEAKKQNFNFDFRIISPEGGTHWISHFCTAVYDEGGQWLGRRESNRDVTERKLAEVELQYMKDGLEAANIELQTALARAQELAHTDSLTGVNNRRHLYELAEREFEVATRYQQPLSIIMFDIDHFKGINDTFGHTIGDQMLQRVTQVACKELRAADVIGRYGGEEFVIILPMTNAQQAYPLAERIRIGVGEIRMPTENGYAAVTLSIGIAEIIYNLQKGSTAEALIGRADMAMFAAKQAGRNRTEIGDH
jgi:diguanylate cyclase (GGDEF)-like protein/PAS domain S-box-containing protein